jgi:hypothetical protein
MVKEMLSAFRLLAKVCVVRVLRAPFSVRSTFLRDINAKPAIETGFPITAITGSRRSPDLQSLFADLHGLVDA